MKSLELTQFPLHGTRLIEASAGTGKTFTLAGLYLRAVVEQGLDIDQILVVTFTQAATEELRGRIRKRLQQALEAFRHKESDDAVEQYLLKSQSDHKPICARLESCITRMDESAVYTIHGFCQRTLQEHAFESGTLFEAQLTTDEATLRREAVADFWRRHFYRAPGWLVRFVMATWPRGPASLEEALRPHLASQAELPTDDDLDAAVERLQTLFQEARQCWQQEGDEVRRLLEDKDANIKRQSYSKRNLPNWLAMLDCFLAQAEPELPVFKQIQNFTPETLSEKRKDENAPEPQHRLFDLCAELLEQSQQLRTLLYAEALQQVREGLALRKREQNLLAFDDLLTDLADALEGENGPRLAQRIREQYPLAMVDEFQDTDPVQYTIFRRIYNDGAGEGGLFLIGDPKQAIYAFRGADIFTYMQARHQTDADDDHFTLDTNWRSTGAMVAAANHLFGKAQAPFIFDDIPFQSVDAAGKADDEPLTLEGETPAALQLWWLGCYGRDDCKAAKGAPPRIGATQTRQEIATAMADEIAALLQAGQAGRALLGERPLQARDIAVLVQSHTQASEVQAVLQAHGIASVYIGRDSVYESPQAEPLRWLLHAVAEPAREGLIRAALCSPLLGENATEMQRLLENELAWEKVLLEFQDYHRLWLERGFMAMFQHLLHRRAIPARLLSGEHGERAITDLLQLAELLHQESQQRIGIDSLLRWYDDQCLNPDGEQEVQQLRLESDEALVQIVTVHKSKGLEYPLVFLPFLAQGPKPRGGDLFSYHDPVDGRLRLNLGVDDPQAKAQYEREQLAESLRLLYVALTRAKYRSYLPLGAIDRCELSALAYLLYQPALDALTPVEALRDGVKQLDDAALYRCVRTLVDTAPNGSVDLTHLPPPRVLTYREPQGEVEEAPGLRHFSGHLYSDFRIGSYSGLIAGSDTHTTSEQPDYDALAEVETPTVAAPTQGVFAFPRGAQAGQMLHTLFEQIDFPEAGGVELERVIERQLERFGFEPEWHGTLVNLVADVLDTPLDSAPVVNEQGHWPESEAPLHLRDIPEERRVVEMEFHLPVGELAAAPLDLLLGRLSPNSGRPPLAFATLRGMLKGFIDLVFEHRGRFYIVDYKSNHLGNRVEAYGLEAMHHAVLEHYYDLQYLLYTVALHRYLRRRLADYDYQRHFGGVAYLFLRGMRAGDGRYGVYRDRPPLALIEELDTLLDTTLSLGDEGWGEGED